MCLLLDVMAKRYGQLPSGLLKIEDAWAAYQFDMAVMTLGLHVEAETRDGKKKVDEVLRDLAPQALTSKAASPAGEYASVRQWAKKVRLKDDGTWSEI